MKTGVLVHGCNLNIENWRAVAWGEPADALGRIPKGVLVAEQYAAEVIVFGTGASHRRFHFNGAGKDSPPLTEAEFSFEFLKTHFDQLRGFRPLREQIAWLDEQVDPAEYHRHRDELLDRIVLESDAMNTAEEITNAGRIFAERGCRQVFLVSSPSHIIRCLRDAASIWHADPQAARFRHNIYACPSFTCYEGTRPEDVVVVEPPHRPDRHVVPTHRRIQRMLTLQRLPYEQLVNLIEEFDGLLQKYEDVYFSNRAKEDQRTSN